MEALDAQHHAGLATRAAPDPSLNAGTLAQATTEEPLVCLSTYGCPILMLLMHWGGFQPSGADVLSCDKVGAKPFKEDTRSQASKWLWWARAADLL